MLKSTMQSVIMLSVIMPSVIMLSVIMLSVIMLSVIMLSVIMLNVIMASVIMPNVTIQSHGASSQTCQFFYFFILFWDHRDGWAPKHILYHLGPLS